MIDCIKCKAWDMAAKASGKHSGMCEECFNKNFVSVNLEYEVPPLKWKNIIGDIHINVCEELKESKPGTPEWKLCMTMLHAYHTWYLGTNSIEIPKKENEEI
jgi:hypothetical protein